MNPLFRLLIPIPFVLTPSLVSQGNDLLRQHGIQQLQETRKCFGCNLSKVNFSGANLERVDLRSANLQGANLKNTNLRYANLEWADIRQANLQGADLTGAILKNTLLSDADLQKANLSASNLEGTDFRNANLSYANLMKASKNNDIQGHNSVNFCETVLPNGTISGRCNQPQINQKFSLSSGVN
ncbi:MAG: pentapeptide repeat-containing protein [Nostoc sp.]|uniref:pentapeptide repeat-containing protein n=1 Tax=Nostoc sp. TaxID=1180 RepID=UPI002FF9D9FA